MRNQGILKFNSIIVWIFAVGLVTFALAGCNAKPYDYEPTAGEMKPGPGVFTGESGELTIYDSKKGGFFPKESSAEPGETSGEKTADTSAETTAAAGTKAVSEPAVTDEEAREFQQFQEWKKEKEQFHDYQQWKKSDKGAAEFKEFQEYQDWKKKAKGSADLEEFREWKEFKAYQEWKKAQQK